MTLEVEDDIQAQQLTEEMAEEVDAQDERASGTSVANFEMVRSSLERMVSKLAALGINIEGGADLARTDSSGMTEADLAQIQAKVEAAAREAGGKEMQLAVSDALTTGFGGNMENVVRGGVEMSAGALFTPSVGHGLGAMLSTEKAQENQQNNGFNTIA